MTDFRLTGAYVEFLHDEVVATHMPFDEPIDPSAFKDRALIESAVNRPFQTAFQQEIYSTLPQKAAALFHSLTCNHCFLNGNKRTAVIALDVFLVANGFMLLLNNQDVYEMAKSTAEANAKLEKIDRLLTRLTEEIDGATMPFDMLLTDTVIEMFTQERAQKMFEYCCIEQSSIRQHPLNQNPGADIT